MFRIITLFLTLVLVIGALSACASAGVGASGLSAEKKAEIETAFYDYKGNNIAFSYYGSFEEYHIFRCYGALSAGVMDEITIAGEKFEFSSPTEFFAFRDGTVQELNALYEKGKISKEAISQLAQFHKEKWNQYPKVPEELNIPFRRAYAAFHYSLVWENKSSRTIHYYGNFDGYDVFYYFPVDASPKNACNLLIGNEVLTYNTECLLFAYRNGEIALPASRLYPNCVLSDSSISAIAKIHQKVYDTYG